MEARRFDDNAIPYFCYDRNMTAGQIRAELKIATEFEWLRLASWIMREAKPSDVWAFLTPHQVDQHLDALEPFLHRRKDFWRFIFTAWHELGKL